MSELIVIGYENHDRAEHAREVLFGLAHEYLVDINDAVVATADDKGKIKLNQYVNTLAIGAGGGAFWGILVGLIFFNPLLGLAAGAATGAVAGALTDYGINDKFMKHVAEVLRPGQAALFILAGRASSDRVIDKLGAEGGRILRTNLDTSQEQRLRDAFVRAHRDTETVAPADADDKAEAV